MIKHFTTELDIMEDINLTLNHLRAGYIGEKGNEIDVTELLISKGRTFERICYFRMFCAYIEEICSMANRAESDNITILAPADMIEDMFTVLKAIERYSNDNFNKAVQNIKKQVW